MLHQAADEPIPADIRVELHELVNGELRAAARKAKDRQKAAVGDSKGGDK